jgi:hypothetical protein
VGKLKMSAMVALNACGMLHCKQCGLQYHVVGILSAVLQRSADAGGGVGLLYDF